MNEIEAIEEAQDIIHRCKQRIQADLDLMDRDLFQLKMRFKGRIEDEMNDQSQAEVKKLMDSKGFTEEEAKKIVYGLDRKEA